MYEAFLLSDYVLENGNSIPSGTSLILEKVGDEYRIIWVLYEPPVKLYKTSDPVTYYTVSASEISIHAQIECVNNSQPLRF